jgi:hypothetical protein
MATPHKYPFVPLTGAETTHPSTPDAQAQGSLPNKQAPADRARLWSNLWSAERSPDLARSRSPAANSRLDCLDDVDCFDW